MADSRKEIKIVDLANIFNWYFKKKGLKLKKIIDKNQSPKRRLADNSKILKDTNFKFNSKLKDNLRKITSGMKNIYLSEPSFTGREKIFNRLYKFRLRFFNRKLCKVI